MADRRLAWALVAVIVRYLTTIQPHAKRELARWRQRALAIPDPELRAHVLRPFDADGSAPGASLFAVLAPLRTQRRLIRLLIAYVLLWSYVDVRTERDPDADPRLYDALVDALRPDVSARLPEDECCLSALLTACRRGCAALPSWDVVQATALRHAEDGRAVQAINHGPRAGTELRLRRWASHRPGRPWHERTAAASSPLAILALMALAAQPTATEPQVVATATAYQPVSALGVVCDHLVDQAEDDALMNHSYLRYVDAPTQLDRRLRDLGDRAVQSVRRLPGGERHTIILTSMVAMFLSDPAVARTGVDVRLLCETVGHPAPLLCLAFGTRRQR